MMKLEYQARKIRTLQFCTQKKKYAEPTKEELALVLHIMHHRYKDGMEHLQLPRWQDPWI